MSIIVLTDRQFNQLMQHFTNVEAKIMAAIDDLNTAVATLTTDVNTCIADLKAAAATATAALDDQIETAVANVNELDAAVKAADPGPQTPPAA